jgi:hypothetical protein
MYIVLYRWRTKKGMEDQLIKSWSEVTKFIVRNYDSHGSRLHLGDDGIWYAYAQWKSAEQREKAFAEMPELDARNKMREAIEESFPEIILTNVSDHWV